MPLLSLGGMRFQQSWSDLPAAEILPESQANLRATLEKAAALGLHHIETARHYGTSERQLGSLLASVPDPQRILQSKVPPQEDPAGFEAELERSFRRLGLADPERPGRLDLLAIHGINEPGHLEQTLRPGGCLEVVRRWQERGRIGAVGFSTHAPLELIEEAIASDQFDYVNLHWYFIRQDNRPAIERALAHDMGVFVISPTDKGGHLHTPSERLRQLCEPLHPIVFNDLFCLSAPGIHTISVGAAGPADLDLHLEAVALLPRAAELLPPILERLEQARRDRLGPEWLASWRQGLPEWEHTPGGINLPVLLWLHNLVEAWDLVSFARARYGLLGNGGHWFPGRNADLLDQEVSEAELLAVLGESPWAAQLPELLRRRVGGQEMKRLAVP
ncbi:MAG: aldo/keto reductase [Synechococcus sp.]|nr:aldo/keto reductase [Synechococcus sp.]